MGRPHCFTEAAFYVMLIAPIVFVSNSFNMEQLRRSLPMRRSGYCAPLLCRQHSANSCQPPWACRLALPKRRSCYCAQLLCRQHCQQLRHSHGPAAFICQCVEVAIVRLYFAGNLANSCDAAMGLPPCSANAPKLLLCTLTLQATLPTAVVQPWAMGLVLPTRSTCGFDCASMQSTAAKQPWASRLVLPTRFTWYCTCGLSQPPCCANLFHLVLCVWI